MLQYPGQEQNFGCEAMPQSRFEVVRTPTKHEAYVFSLLMIIIIMMVTFKRLSLKAVSALQNREGEGGTG